MGVYRVLGLFLVNAIFEIAKLRLRVSSYFGLMFVLCETFSFPYWARLITQHDPRVADEPDPRKIWRKKRIQIRHGARKANPDLDPGKKTKDQTLKDKFWICRCFDLNWIRIDLICWIRIRASLNSASGSPDINSFDNASNMRIITFTVCPRGRVHFSCRALL